MGSWNSPRSLQVKGHGMVLTKIWVLHIYTIGQYGLLAQLSSISAGVLPSVRWLPSVPAQSFRPPNLRGSAPIPILCSSAAGVSQPMNVLACQLFGVVFLLFSQSHPLQSHFAPTDQPAPPLPPCVFTVFHLG